MRPYKNKAEQAAKRIRKRNESLYDETGARYMNTHVKFSIQEKKLKIQEEKNMREAKKNMLGPWLSDEGSGDAS